MSEKCREMSANSEYAALFGECLRSRRMPMQLQGALSRWPLMRVVCTARLGRWRSTARGALWQTYQSAEGWPFRRESDRLGIGVGVMASSVREHLVPLLDISVKQAYGRMRGRCTWAEEERDRLVEYMAASRARLTRGQMPGDTSQAEWRGVTQAGYDEGAMLTH